MKVAMIFCMLLSTAAFQTKELHRFNDKMEVKKVVIMDEILINELIKLYKGYDFEDERMVAGEFEKKALKKSYLDGLRDKFLNNKGPSRFL